MGLNKAKDLEGMKGFDVDLQFGKHFEELLDDIFKGVHKSEIKTERDQWIGYGNMVVETASKAKPSGLTRTEADLWIHNFSYKGELVFSLMVPVERLRRVVDKMIEDKVARVTKGGDGWRSTLALLPLDEILRYLREGAKDNGENNDRHTTEDCTDTK